MKKKIESPFNKNFNQVLKDRNISQKTVAEIGGVSASVISGWCIDSTPHDLTALLRICQALKIDFQWLVTGVSSIPNLKDITLSEIFDVSDEPDFEGVFQISMKRLKRKKL